MEKLMWQIMWLLGLVPDFVWHLLLIFCLFTIIATYFLRMVPFIGANVVQLRFAAIALLILTVWMEGGIANEAKWQARVQELEAKVAESEKRAVEANSKIETVYVDKVQVVKEIQYVVKKEISKSANDLDANCRITPLAVDILNKSIGTNK